MYNPTLIESVDVNDITKSNIDPFYRYKSTAEKNGSRFIGKNILISGDSQWVLDAPGLYIAEELGANIINKSWGSHSIGLDTNSIGTEGYNWFYSILRKNDILSQQNIDIYWLTWSSNDFALTSIVNSSLTQAATQRVINNYPSYGDDAATSDSKMALFNALTTDQLKEYFAFQQCYSAFLKQLQTLYPKATVILSTLPITCSNYITSGNWSSGKTADGARTDYQQRYLDLRNKIYETSDKHNIPVIDLYKEVELTFENFPVYCRDGGVHWVPEILRRAAYKFIDFALNKIKSIAFNK
jgi:hypothetical protein